MCGRTEFCYRAIMRIYRKRRGNRWYLYAQESVRVGNRVTTPTRYIGPADGGTRKRKNPFALEPGEVQADKAMQEYTQKLLAEEGQPKQEIWSQKSFLERTAEPEKSPASSGTSEANDVAGEPSVGQA